MIYPQEKLAIKFTFAALKNYYLRKILLLAESSFNFKINVRIIKK